MLSRAFQSLAIFLAIWSVALVPGCQPDQVNRDSRGNRLPDNPPQHTPPPREPSN